MNIISGRIKCNKNYLNLSLTLLGGQSFRWKKLNNNNNNNENNNSKNKFIGIMYDNFWELQQIDENYLEYKCYKSSITKTLNKTNIENILKTYFRLDFNLMENFIKWKLASEHFEKITTKTIRSLNNDDNKQEEIQITNENHQFSGIRLLNQEPFENIISFICSQNNNIKRITQMIDWFCSNYGIKICNYENIDYYTFPSIEIFKKICKDYDDDNEKFFENFENQLRTAKFGYRAKYITKTIKQIIDNGGNEWLMNLKLLSYMDARKELLKLNGIGPKVTDCICLMSLNHLQSVPIDTHMYQVAKRHNLFNDININSNCNRKNKKTQNITPVVYEKIGDTFRKIYGPYAGWAQLVLFCSDLKQFKE